jgi:hypothetical protein
MKRTAARLAWLAVAALVPMISSCKDDSLPGDYTATTFTITPQGGATQDVLAAGGHITLSIANDFTTAGNLSIPASIDGGPVSVSMLGNMVKQGDEITFDLVADSFMRDMTFTFSGNTLSAIDTFSGTTVAVTLSK